MSLLSDEITNDPLLIGYSEMNEQEIAESLNTTNRSSNKASMSSSEVFNVVDKTEFNALTVANKQLIWDMLHLGELNPFGLEATLFTDIFGGGSDTIVELASLRTTDISRAQELGITPSKVKVGHVQMAQE